MVNGVAGKVFTLQFANVWTGLVDSSWENPANWSCGFIPDADTDVYIPSGIVTVNSNVVVGSLIVAPGVIFTVGGGYTITITH